MGNSSLLFYCIGIFYITPIHTFLFTAASSLINIVLGFLSLGGCSTLFGHLWKSFISTYYCFDCQVLSCTDDFTRFYRENYHSLHIPVWHAITNHTQLNTLIITKYAWCELSSISMHYNMMNTGVMIRYLSSGYKIKHY